MGISEQLIKTFTPTGKLRASINLGNPILVNRRPETGEPYGVSIDLAHAFAQRLGAELELVIFDSAGKSVEAVTRTRLTSAFRHRSLARRACRSPRPMC